MSRKLISLSLLLFALMIGASQAAAQEPPFSTATFPAIEILDADYGGNGCPEGTASVLFIGNTLTILFDEYNAETYPGRQNVNRSCNFGVTLSVPEGYTIALLKIDYRGFADIPSGGYGRLRAEYFWAGDSGPVYTRWFWPPFLDNWIETDFVGGTVWSPCDEAEVIARANTSVLARKASPWSSYEAQLSVDSVDLEAGIILYFDYDYC